MICTNFTTHVTLSLTVEGRTMNREKTRGTAPSISPSGTTPAFTIMCGDRHEQRYIIARYQTMGFEVNNTAAIQLILDAPRGYVFTALASER